MRLRCVDDPAVFWQRVGAFLLDNEATYNLAIGIVRQAIDKPGCFGPGMFMALVKEDETVKGAAVMTPGFPVVLTHGDDAALSLIAETMVRQQLPVKGVVAPPGSASLFAEHYCRLQPDMVARIDKEMCIYRLDAVIPPPRTVAGRMRTGTMRDLSVATDYLEGFVRVSGHSKLFDAETVVKSAIEEKRLFFWQTTHPVSMAVWVRETPNMKAVGYVYTPASEEGKGYASHLVAEMSRECLASGKRHCVLYADCDNPVSNHIYQKLGYRFVDDSRQMIIEPKSASMNRG